MSDQYFPSNPSEKAYFDSLWVAAHQSGDVTTDLSGSDAVAFFRKSNIDTGILRSIWSLCTPVMTMNISQFYTAMRYIALAQAGEMPITRDRLLATIKTNLPLPKFADINIPTVVPVSAAPVSTTGGAVPPYAITPEDHAKYHKLFLTYDTDHDGFLQANEAAAIFSKSGLDNSVLAVIWSMSDYDHDNRLSSKEFSLAFHLIVCIGKKKMPVPTTLPPVLVSFVQNAPAVPVAMTAPVTQTTPVVPVVPTSIMPTPAPVRSVIDLPPPEPVKLTIPPPTTTATSQSSISTMEDQMELESSVRSISDVAKKAIASQERAVDSTDKASSSLKYILQKLSAEKIALISSLSLAEEDEHKSLARLEATATEVGQLHAEVEELRHTLESKRISGDSVKEQTHTADADKQELLRTIQDLRAQLGQSIEGSQAQSQRVKDLTAEHSSLSVTVSAHQVQATQLEQDIQRAQSEVEVLKSIVAGLKESHSAVLASSRTLSAQSSALQMTNSDLRSEANDSAAKVAALHKQKAEVEAEKSALLHQLQAPGSAPAVVVVKETAAAVLPVPVPVPVPVIIPTVVTTSAPLAEAVDKDDDDEGQFNDGDTGDVTAPVVAEESSFASLKEDYVETDFPAPTAEVTEAFEAFPDPAHIVGTKDVVDPFADSAFPPASSEDFGEFPSDAFASFDAFGSEGKPAAAVEGGGAGFGAGFGSDPFASPATKTSTAAATHDGAFPEGDFPPPSGDFESFGDFEGGFVEESFKSPHDSPW